MPAFNGHINWSHLPLGEGQGDTDVGVKGAGAGTTRGADDGGAELALEEALDEAIVVLHVTGQRLRCHLLIRTTCPILRGGEEEEREEEEREEGEREEGGREEGEGEEKRKGGGTNVVCCVKTQTTQPRVLVTSYPLMSHTPRQHKYTDTL